MGIFNENEIIDNAEKELISVVYEMADKLFAGVLKPGKTSPHSKMYRFEESMTLPDKSIRINHFERQFSNLIITREKGKFYISRLADDLPVLIKKEWFTYDMLADKFFKLVKFKDSSNLTVCDVYEFYTTNDIRPVEQRRNRFKINKGYKTSMKTYPVTLRFKEANEWV